MYFCYKMIVNNDILLSEINMIQQRWATKKAGGSSHNGRDSHGKRLGVKKFEGKYIIIFSFNFLSYN